MNQKKSCLLIGNTHWHWATKTNKDWIFTHKSPNQETLAELSTYLWKWAAVGPMPKGNDLDPSKCIQSRHIPLLQTPKWIGVDRALASWGAFKKAKSQNLHTKGILVADAGTILSLNKIQANGKFSGGQLIAGLHLQRSAMSNRAEKLQPIQSKDLSNNEFPLSTEEAMLRGSFQALFLTLLETQRKENMPLWLCGGDSKIFYEHLKDKDCNVHHCPNLAIEALTQIDR